MHTQTTWLWVWG